MLRKHPPTKRTDGFTLVELSIVTIIIGLLTAGGLAAGAKMVERAAYIDTRKLIQQLQDTLKHYYIVNGRLPCPSSLDVTIGSSEFGVEQSCGTTGVRVGGVPTRALGLPDSAAADKFGSRIIYAVSESLTDANNFGLGVDAITVQDMNNSITTPNAAYVLVSMGRDRKGAVIHNTGERPRSCGSSANLDTLNCSLTTAEFRDAPFNNGDVENRFFDDVVAWAPKFHFTAFDTQSNALWALRGGTDNIYAIGAGNMALTNVGIGTETPEAKLTVANGAIQLQNNAAPANRRRMQLMQTSTGQFVLRRMRDDLTPLNDVMTVSPPPYGDIAFHTQAKENILFINGLTGRVGINTDEPRADLDVRGLIHLGNKYLDNPGLQLASAGKLQIKSLSGASTGIDFRGSNNERLFSVTTGPSYSLIKGGDSFFRLWLAETYARLATPSGGGGLYMGDDGWIALGANEPREELYLWNGRISTGGKLENGIIITNNGHGGKKTWSDAFLITSDRSSTLRFQGGSSSAMQDIMVFRTRNVAIGHDNPSYKLDVNGTLRATSVTQTSDARLKTDIQTVENVLEKLSMLRGVSFRWKENSGNTEDARHLGVIAQEVEKVFPELITKDNQGFLTVEMNGLIAPIIEAVNTLNREHTILLERIEKLEATSQHAASLAADTIPTKDSTWNISALLWLFGGIMLVLICKIWSMQRQINAIHSQRLHG